MSSDENVQLAATGYDLLFTHAVLWGAGSIAAAAHDGVRLGWTGHMSKVAVLYGIGATELAVAVRDRAEKAGDPSHWVQGRSAARGRPGAVQPPYQGAAGTGSVGAVAGGAAGAPRPAWRDRVPS